MSLYCCWTWTEGLGGGAEAYWKRYMSWDRRNKSSIQACSTSRYLYESCSILAGRFGEPNYERRWISCGSAIRSKDGVRNSAWRISISNSCIFCALVWGNLWTFLCLHDTAEVHPSSVQSARVCGYCANWRIHGHCHSSSVCSLLSVKTWPRNVASALTDRLVQQCILTTTSETNGACIRDETPHELHGHGDERWPTEVTSKHLFALAICALLR